MSRFINPDAYHILASDQEPDNRAKCQSEEQAQPNREPTRWEMFKAKAKNVWHSVMAIASGIRENIVPILTGVGNFFSGFAALRKNRQKAGYCGCSA